MIQKQMTTLEVCNDLRPLFKRTKGNKTDRLLLNRLHNKHLTDWDEVDKNNFEYLVNKYK